MVLGDSNHQGFLLIDKTHAASIQVCCVMLQVYYVDICALQKLTKTQSKACSISVVQSVQAFHQKQILHGSVFEKWQVQ